MNGSEIISLLTNNLSVITTPIAAVVGSLLTSIFLRHNTETEEFEKIKAGKFKAATETLLKNGKMTYTEFYKAKNFLDVAQKADEYYSQKIHTQDNITYDFDWYVRFYEAVGNISNEKMQEIWAKILAGEVDHPGRFSLKSIDILKNISKSDAELFERLCACSFSNGSNTFVPNYDEYLKSSDVKYSEILRLDELGLINSSGLLVLKINVPQGNNIVFCDDKYAVIIRPRDGNLVPIDIKQFPLTSAGRELYQIHGVSTPEKCFLSFGAALAKNKQIEVGIHQVMSINGDHIEYNPINLLVDDIATE